MKRLLLIIAMLALQSLFANVFAEEWGPLTNGVQTSVKMWTGHAQITTNETVLLQFQIRNTTTNETFYFRWWATFENSFSYMVISPSGEKLSQRSDAIIAGSSGPIPIRSNDTHEYNLDLNKLYKFDELGTYKITVKAVLVSESSLLSHGKKTFWGDGDEAFEVTSNPLLVTVVSKK